MAVLAGLAFLLFGAPGSQLTSPIAQAATVSSSTPGYRMHMALAVTAPGLSGGITATGRGIVDLRDHATSMSLTMHLASDPQVAQQINGAMRMDLVMRGADVYAKLPGAVADALPTSGRQWVKIDLGKLAALPGVSSFDSDPAATDPSQILPSLESVSNNVVNMGTERIDGIQTTHYRAEVSASRLMSGFPSADAALAKQVLTLLQRSLPGGALPVDVWIDRSHLVRRVQMNFELDFPNSQTVQESMTIDVSDYGPQPEPAAPPADQVVDLSGLAGAAG